MQPSSVRKDKFQNIYSSRRNSTSSSFNPLQIPMALKNRNIYRPSSVNSSEKKSVCSQGKKSRKDNGRAILSIDKQEKNFEHSLRESKVGNSSISLEEIIFRSVIDGNIDESRKLIESVTDKSSIRIDILQTLKSGKEENQISHFSAQSNNISVLHFLLDIEFDLETQNVHGMTPLMLAVYKGHKQIVGMLSSVARKINLQNRQGSTALHFAIVKGDLSIIETLLSHPSIDPEIMDNEKCKAIDLAQPQDFIQIQKLKLSLQTKNAIGSASVEIANDWDQILSVDYEKAKGSEKTLSRTSLKNQESTIVSRGLSRSGDIIPLNQQIDSNPSQDCQPKQSSEHTPKQKLTGLTGFFDSEKRTGLFTYTKPPVKTQWLPNKSAIGSKTVTSEVRNNIVMKKKPIISHPKSIRNSLMDGILYRPPPLISNSNQKVSTEPKKISISSFKLHSVIGKGSFSNVYLVEKIDNGIFYAMKVLEKAKTIRDNLKRYVLTEKNVLSSLNHPFITKLHYAFQSPEHFFLILQYCPGGNLGKAIRIAKFTESRAKIYAAEILLAIEELHRKNIIFRDLKPENIVLDAEGHALLIDFGLSKENILEADLGTKSFCGSVAYLAPEMISKSGHGKALDWYLLGVLIYEMITGIPPFYSDTKQELFDNVLNSELERPPNCSEELFLLLSLLLDKNPTTRLGSNSVEDIKNHIWFSDINWDEALSRKLKPPLPKLEKIEMNKIRKNPFTKGELSKEAKVVGWTFIQQGQNDIQF